MKTFKYLLVQYNTIILKCVVFHGYQYCMILYYHIIESLFINNILKCIVSGISSFNLGYIISTDIGHVYIRLLPKGFLNKYFQNMVIMYTENCYGLF